MEKDWRFKVVCRRRSEGHHSKKMLNSNRLLHPHPHIAFFLLCPVTSHQCRYIHLPSPSRPPLKNCCSGEKFSPFDCYWMIGGRSRLRSGGRETFVKVFLFATEEKQSRSSDVCTTLNCTQHLLEKSDDAWNDKQETR